MGQYQMQAYTGGHQDHFTQKTSPAYVDPDYNLSTEWVATKQHIDAALRPSRVLLICGSARNDGICPGEMSKTLRLLQIARETLEQANLLVDVLDLSLLSSQHGRKIRPYKGCVSATTPLYHWPNSCYPNHALNQANDWMADIYQRWTAAHAVTIVSPVYWYQSPSPLKLMIDRMVCAEGGSPDLTSTSGSKAGNAKALEMDDWGYPQHLAGRAYGLIVHGDAAGVEDSSRALSDWFDRMGFMDAGTPSQLDRDIGYYQPYASGHHALDLDEPVKKEARNVARAVARAVVELRAGRLQAVTGKLAQP
jgi:multimeric flavodoxin WrbA